MSKDKWCKETVILSLVVLEIWYHGIRAYQNSCDVIFNLCIIQIKTKHFMYFSVSTNDLCSGHYS